LRWERAPGRQIGHFFWAVDVTAFGPRDEFLARVDAQIEQIKASERLEGIDEIVVPGERGYRRRAALLADATLWLGEATWAVIRQTCESLSVSPPVVLQPA